MRNFYNTPVLKSTLPSAQNSYMASRRFETGMNISRRNLLKASTAVPFLIHTQASRGAEQALALRPRAVVINGKATFLIAGSIDYFRCPHRLWRDRLMKAKRAGRNMVMTNISWNFHEREEGVFDFEGDCDVGPFSICATSWICTACSRGAVHLR